MAMAAFAQLNGVNDHVGGGSGFGGGKAQVAQAPSTRVTRLDQFKLRVRKEIGGQLTSRRGPLVARHHLPQSLTPTPSPPTPPPLPTAPALGAKRPRTPPPGSPGVEGSRQRKRSPSLTKSRPCSPSGSRRAASPGALDPAVMEAVKRRVGLVQQARLYLLQQPGPNSFLVSGDSPQHKYRVVIGPQTCSCSKGPHCVHLLFVMLRVLQVPESDNRIYMKELKNFEVESLFQNYQERVKLRVNNSMSLASLYSMSDSGPNSIGSSGFGSESPSSMNTHDSRIQARCRTYADSQTVAPDAKSEEDLCPICLLEMVDGESLVKCSSGCRNKLHHQCMAIWAAECCQQGEPVLCPLCRRAWSGSTTMLASPTFHNPCLSNHQEKTVHNCVSESTLTQTSQFMHHQNLRSPTTTPSYIKNTKRASFSICNHTMKITSERRGSTGAYSAGFPSTSHKSVPVVNTCWCPNGDISLPHTEAIPAEQMGVSAEWIKVFGEDLVSCLYSRDWKAREIAFLKLKSDVSVAHLSDNEDHQQRILSCCAKILAVFAADPVYKVYEAWVRCLQVMLNHARCRGRSRDVEELQRLVKPIIRALLLKCADSNRRTSQLSIDVLLQLAKGLDGGLAIGLQFSSPVDYNSNMNPCGLNLSLVLGCILEDGIGEVTPSNWQWLAGRLVLLDRLLITFKEEFTYPKLHTTQRLNLDAQRHVNMLEFCASCLRSSHVTVGKLARHLFVALLSLAVDIPHRSPLLRARQLLACFEPSLQSRLHKMFDPAILSVLCDSNLVKKEDLITSQSVRKLSPTKTDLSPARAGSFLTPHGIENSLPPKPSKNTTVPTTSSSLRPRYLDLSRPKTKRPVKFHHLPGIGGTASIPVTPVTGVSPKRCGPISPHAPRLYNLFVKKTKADEITVLPTKPDIASTCLSICDVSSSPERRLLDDHCKPSNFWAVTPTSPTVPHSTPVKDSNDGLNPSIILYPSVVESESVTDEEIEVPFVFEKFPSKEPHFPLNDAFHQTLNSQEHCLESLTKVESAPAIGVERYREGLDWIRGHILGTGAFSACYQAWDITTGTIMAVKQVSFCRNTIEEQDRVENAVRQELAVLKTLRHENIVRMIGATRQSTHFNMFVEWMAGGSVAGLLERYGTFSNRVILGYTQQVLCGLNYLHEKHILHRDLKGANLLVDSSGKHLRIGDLGTAAQLTAARTQSGEFQGQLLGTVAFMAPEVLRGEDYGRLCDIWSVGCCMIEMATTKPPWRESLASNYLALMYKIACSKDPPRIPDCLQGVARKVALDCLQVEVDLRPSAKALLQMYYFNSITESSDNSESNLDSGFYCESYSDDFDDNFAKVQISAPDF